ncbi:hypothetical protein [Bradyrhizobium sp. OAE829]|uniref:hypothetical protein n=1 Tax=Bradyrhizobium sp. OAE829 TaxID=2663807 RepID=UPI00178BCEA4
MISWRFAVPTVLGAAALAAWITYGVFPISPPLIEENRRMPTVSEGTGSQDIASEDEMFAYQRAAAAILKRNPNAKASADELPLITGRIPLPKPRPLPRP